VSSTVIAPLIVSHSVDNDILTLDGTAVAGSTVTIFSGTTIIGTSTASAQGVWVFTTGTLANGTYSVTATGKSGAAGQSSACVSGELTAPRIALVNDSRSAHEL
jgi:hypothetical protein